MPKREAALAVGHIVHERTNGAGRLTSGGLDLDDVGSKVGEQLAADWAS